MSQILMICVDETFLKDGYVEVYVGDWPYAVATLRRSNGGKKWCLSSEINGLVVPRKWDTLPNQIAATQAAIQRFFDATVRVINQVTEAANAKSEPNA